MGRRYALGPGPALRRRFGVLTFWLWFCARRKGPQDSGVLYWI